MKTPFFQATFLAFFLLIFRCHAQIPLLSSPTNVTAAIVNQTDLKVTDRGPHHRIWQYKTLETNPAGQTREHLHSYTELATGLYYEENGVWKESEAVIEIDPDGGAKAVKGQHKAFFAGNINSEKAVELLTPDNKKLSSRILGLSYFDSATGQSVLIAQLKDAQGFIVAPNQVIYPDAFTDFKADVRYTYTLARFEQDLILREQPPSPAVYGLNPNTTRLQLLTEFTDPPVPVRQNQNKEGREVDNLLDFGIMEIGTGKAFLTDTKDLRDNISVDKQWVKLNNRDFLIEELKYSRIKAKLDTLPAHPGAALKPKENGVRHLVSNKRLLPEQKMASREKMKPIQVASLNSQSRGFVLDYSIVTSQGGFTFKGDTTYYVTNAVNLSGSTIIEGGTVVKFKTNNAATVTIGAVEWNTSAYRPAVFTSMHDNSAGEIIPGSTGNPWTSYAGGGVSFAVPGSSIRDARFSFLISALTLNGGGTWYGANLQFVGSVVAVTLPNYDIPAEGCSFQLDNSLFYSNTYVLSGANVTVQAQHLTVHKANTFNDLDNANVTLKNSLLVSVFTDSYSAGNGSKIYNSTDTVSIPSDIGVFQSAGAGGHYLTVLSPFRNVGTTNISASMLSNLRKKTTYPPIVFLGLTIPTDLTLSPQAQRDTDTPDLGYHYDALDYAFGGVDANANLTFTPGTAVGWFRTNSGYYHAGHGIHMGDTKIAKFDGRPEAPCYWVRCNTVQEGGTGVGDGGYSAGGITGWADMYGGDFTKSPEVQAQFTRCSMLGGEVNHFRDDWGYLNVRANNCEFWGGGIAGYTIGFYLTNCLMERVAMGQVEGWIGNAISLRNCTMKGGSFGLNRWHYALPVSFRDCAFDGSAISVNDSRANNPLVTDYANNAFLNGASRTTPINANDKLVSSFNWQTGSLGKYYLPSDSTLIDAGSQSAPVAGFYHFTTQVNQVKEANSLLDIGYHYVALNSLNQPIDSNGNGVADYLEDSNGNGLVDPGEGGWWIAPSAYGLTSGSGLKVFTLLK